jgi:hypothetical protein
MTDLWWGPGRSMTERHERAARTVIDESGGTAAFDLIVLAGSLHAGLGHGHSDVDLFVLPADGSTAPERVRFVDGVPVQFNDVRVADLELMAETFNAYAVVPEDRSQLLALRRPAWVKLATRLAFGRVLHASPDCAALLGRCDPEVLRLLLLTDAARMVSRLAEDAAGALLTEDPLLALHASGEALRYAAEGAMVACGDVFVSDCGHWRRLAKLPALADIVPALWGLTTERPCWGASWPGVRTHVRRVLTVATHLISHAQLDGWRAPMEKCPLPPARPAGDFSRNPLFQVLRFGDTIAIVGPDKAFRCNDATARAWLRTDVDPTGIPTAGIEQFRTMGLLEPTDHDHVERG